MNRLTLLLLLCLSGTPAFARDGFTLSASYGAGFSYQRGALNTAYMYGGAPWTFSPALSRKADLYISYQTRHWIIQTGIGYWRNGYTRTAVDLYAWTNSGYNPLNSNGSLGVVYSEPRFKETIIYPQIVLPLLLGYRFGITKKLSVTPFIGYTFSYNLKSTMKFEEGDQKREYRFTDDLFYRGYKHTSSSVAAHVDVSYQILPRCSIFAGPRFWWMLTRLNTGNDNWNYEGGNFKLCNITLNAGISWHLAKEKVRAKE